MAELEWQILPPDRRRMASMVASWPKRAVSLLVEFQLGVKQGKGALGLLVALWALQHLPSLPPLRTTWNSSWQVR